MAIYFYSTNKSGKINALAGVKSIVLPYKALDYVDENLVTNNSKKYGAAIKNIIEKNEDSNLGDFLEEYDHFKCLTHCSIAGTFHLRNVLIRVLFSHTTNKQFKKEKVSQHFVYKEVTRYYFDYFLFHFISYPLIESRYFLKKTDENRNNERYETLYNERLRKYILTLSRSKKYQIEFIGKIIDHNYFNSKKRKINQFNEIDSQVINSIDGKISSSSISNFISSIYYELRQLLFYPRLWIHLLKIITKNFRLIFPYVLKRLIPSLYKKQTIGSLPGLEVGKRTIDPAGFSQRQTKLTTVEKRMSKSNTCKSKLLWYILSRVSVIYNFKITGKSSEEILLFFQMQREFISSEWRPEISESGIMPKFTEYDTDLVREYVTNEFCADINRSRLTKKMVIDILEELSISIFDKWKNDYIACSEFKYYEFLDCSYHHI